MRLVNTFLTFSALALLVLTPAMPPLAAVAQAAPGPVAEVVRQGPDGFTLHVTFPEAVREEVDLPGVGRFLRVTVPGVGSNQLDVAGRPLLPRRGFPFGLPEDSEAQVTARVIKSDTFRGLPPEPVPARRIEPGDPFPTETQTFEPDAALYASGSQIPAELVTLSPVKGWRHQRVQAVVVNAVRVVPATGEYRAVREMEIEVTFRGVARAPGRARMVPAGPDAAGWDELIDQTLVNGISAGSFRRRSAPAALPAAVDEDGDYVRVQIGTTGFCRIPYADLSAQGWPSGVATADVRVEERGYDQVAADPYTVTSLPRTVEDTNGNDVFDDGDFVVFYGLNYRDRFDPIFYNDRYSYFHCYWITHSAEGGTEFPVKSGYNEGSGYVEVTSFPHETHYEQDVYYINNPPDRTSIFYPNHSSFYWFDARDVDEVARFDVRYPDPEGSYRVKARWQGMYTTFTVREHLVSLRVNGCQILTDGYFTDRATWDYDSGDMSSGDCIYSGTNTLRISGRSAQTTNNSGAFFDWFEVAYDRLLVATDNSLTFNSGGHRGSLEFNVTGFTAPDIQLYDVSDPLHPFKLEGRVTDAGGSYTLSLRVNVSSGTREFLAVVPESVTGIPPSIHDLPADLDQRHVAPGLPRDLVAAGDGSDIILITHPKFRDAWTPLVNLRESQGHHVFVCDVWEIYDQFAGGDKTPWAIQRFLAQAFRTWNPAPSYLLLGGDASEDYRNDTATSDPDYVPTMMHFGDVGGTNGKELVGTDNWFVAFLREGDPQYDQLPEMHVARLPVSTVDEANIIVDKIIRFETEDPDADWRKRGLFLADDQYSTSITSASSYQYNIGELKFQETTQMVCDSIPALGRMPDFTCEPFFLGAYLDTVEALGRTVQPGDEPDLIQTSQYVREHVRPIFVDKLSRGWLVWEYTGHGNKNVITTELLIEQYPKLGPASRVLDRVNNLNRPYIFLGYACHLNEFEHAREKVDGQCIGEEILFAPNRGGTASFASTGYEWLNTNPDAQRYTTRALFWNLPRDPDTGRPRRILGDCMTRALVANAFENGLNQSWLAMLRTYLTLGDPAMRIDIATAALRADIDGELFDGEPLTAESFNDSLLVEAQLSDDVDISAIRVLEAGTELPESRVAIVRPAPEDEGAQYYQARFKIGLKLGTYDVVLEATDWTGGLSQLVMPVRFDVDWRSDGKVLDPGGSNPLDVDSPVEALVTTPVPLDAGAFEMLLDGEPLAVTPVKADEAGRQWRLAANEVWSGGTHELTVRATGGGTTVERAISIGVSEDSLDLVNAYFYPNPYEEGPASLVYELNHSARDGELSVYTVSGRRVLRTDVPVRAGRNAYRWDIRDAVGDQVANGVYLFVLKIDGYEGESIRHLERVAVTR